MHPPRKKWIEPVGGSTDGRTNKQTDRPQQAICSPLFKGFRKTICNVGNEFENRLCEF